MGELSSIRVNMARPFLNSGVDYCGPFYVRDRIRRNSKKYKAYVAIFVCMVTKVVHIELVEDLTTESFLAALRRFMARKGSRIFRQRKKFCRSGSNATANIRKGRF